MKLQVQLLQKVQLLETSSEKFQLLEASIQKVQLLEASSKNVQLLESSSQNVQLFAIWLKFPVLQLFRAGGLADGRLGLLETKTNSAQLGLQAGAWAELGKNNDFNGHLGKPS